jgi:coenzyme F420-reducing hydrogenase delta subunit
VKYVANLLDQIGLGGERVRMANLSSAMGPQFAELIQEITGRVCDLGPNPLGTTQNT